jgi:hypothetical protein
LTCQNQLINVKLPNMFLEIRYGDEEKILMESKSFNKIKNFLLELKQILEIREEIKIFIIENVKDRILKEELFKNTISNELFYRKKAINIKYLIDGFKKFIEKYKIEKTKNIKIEKIEILIFDKIVDSEKSISYYFGIFY